MNQPIRTILFDLDGTLVDSYGPIRQSLNEVRRSFGLNEKSEAEVRREVGRGLEILIAENVGEENVAEGVGIFRDHYRRVFLGGTRLLPGVAPTIESLAARHYRMGVTSNKPAYFTREILEALGLARCFGTILGPEMVRRPKPDPEMLIRALEELGSERSEAAYVGDMAIDVQVARNAGLPVTVIPSGGHGRDELEKALPDLLLERFEDLLGVFPPLARRGEGTPRRG
jgi:2-phosphoglycolate phosphatase